MKTKPRMQVRFGELAQEIAIVHGVPQDTVDLVLSAYSAAVRRLLAEDIIVEIAEGLRLQRETYHDNRNSKDAERIVVNPEYSRLRRKSRAGSEETQKENERTATKIGSIGTGEG